MDKMLKIEVIYAKPLEQQILTLEVQAGCTIGTAIQLSGVLVLYPEIDLTKQKVGVFSQIKALSDMVCEGDRIEIYRELEMDPKEARKRRAKIRRGKV